MKRIFTIAFLSFVTSAYSQPGNLIPWFGSNGKVRTAVGTSDDMAAGIGLQSDGKIVLVGSSNNGTDKDFAVVRYKENGIIDNTFSGDGKLTFTFGNSDESANAVVIQPDDKIVIAGSATIGDSTYIALVRLNSNGTMDNTFSSDGKVMVAFQSKYIDARSVALQPDGKIVVGGTYYNPTSANNDYAVARFTTTGSLDNTFGSNGIVTTAVGSGDDEGNSIALQSDGKILVSGYSVEGGLDCFSVARYNTDGKLDLTFGNGGKVKTAINNKNAVAYSMAIQQDQKIVLAGTTELRAALARYNIDGTLDNTFDIDGVATNRNSDSLENEAFAVTVQSDQKTVIGGDIVSNGVNGFAIGRLKTDGSFDSTFSGDGLASAMFPGNSYGRAITIYNDRIYIAGYSFNPTTNNYDFAMAAFQKEATLPVKLSPLTASINNHLVSVSWQTYTEQNTDHFEIERSVDGGKFSVIGSLNAAGNSNSILQYSFDDVQPASVNYYRLKVVDKDGQVNYSNTVLVKMAQSGKIAVYPNPSSRMINVQLTTNGKSLQIVNIAGKLIKNIVVKQGERISSSIDISSLPKGTYLLKNGTESIQFIKN